MTLWVALLQDARARHGKVETLAQVLHLTRQRTSDLLAGGRGTSPNVEACLRIAADSQHDPYAVLRSAGHVAEADLLEQMLGPWVPGARDRQLIRELAERLAQQTERPDVDRVDLPASRGPGIGRPK